MSERPQPTVTLNRREFRLVGTHPEYLAAFTDLSAHPLAGIVRRYLPHGAMIFDVGANIGVMALVMALTRPDCQVVAFEPLPTSCDCLRINLEANAVENVRVINAAVSDAPGELRLADNGPWSPVHEGAPIRAAAIRLNDLAAPPPSLIKIDVEGWEPHVLAGASRVLETRPLVFLEFSVWTLLVQHYDPLVFAEVLYRHCDMMAAYAHGGRVAMPRDARCLVHANIMEHGCPGSAVASARAVAGFASHDEGLNAKRCISARPLAPPEHANKPVIPRTGYSGTSNTGQPVG
jgi:FkbM family methyltransferase